MKALIWFLISFCLLSGCGQTGHLYLPKATISTTSIQHEQDTVS